MIQITDQSVYDDIKEILVDEYTELLLMYETFEFSNELENAAETKTAMDEVDILSRKLLGYDISPFALKRFK